MSDQKKPLVIGVNATFNPFGGSKTHLLNIIRYLKELRPFYSMVIFVRPRDVDLFKKADFYDDRIEIFVSKMAGLSTMARVLWEQTLLPFYSKRKKIDILFCPANISPILCPVKKVQWVATIGPLSREIDKYWTPSQRFSLKVVKHLMVNSSKTSEVVIHQSNYSRDLFLKNFNKKKENQKLIQAGKDNFFTKTYENTIDQLPKNFILYVSHLYRYKNIINLLKAFHLSKKNIGPTVKLIIAGNIVDPDYFKSIQNKVSELGLENDVIFLGEVDKEKLKQLYSFCQFLIFPSLCESSGYALIEAMSCGAPITCSNVTAIPDTCANSALYFSPDDVRQMADSISSLSNNENLRKEFAQKSLKRAQELPDFKEVAHELALIFEELHIQ